MRWTWIQRSDLQRSLDDPFFHLVRLLSPFIWPLLLIRDSNMGTGGREFISVLFFVECGYSTFTCQS